MQTVYLSIGSNVGDRKINLRRAVKLLAPKVDVTATSPIYETDPLYIAEQPLFYNAIVVGKTKLTPEKLLEHVQGIESKMGRPGKTHNRPRVIDIDIVAFGDEQLVSDNLTIPHPRLHERAFVLAPLKDVAPTFIDSRSKNTIPAMLEKIPEWKQQVRKTNFML